MPGKQHFGGRDPRKPLAAAGHLGANGADTKIIGADQIQFFDDNLQATKKSVSSVGCPLN